MPQPTNTTHLTKAALRRLGTEAQSTRAGRLDLSVQLPEGMTPATARALILASLKVSPEHVVRTLIDDARRETRFLRKSA